MVVVLALISALQMAAPPDTVRLVGSTLVVEPLALELSLPPEWVGTTDTTRLWGNCGNQIRGRAERRLAVTRATLDSALHATGEWDREYSAVVDSVLPFADLVAHLGPEPFGRGSTCFGDLQLRVYLSRSSPSQIVRNVATRGLPVAKSFFNTATTAIRDSAEWRIASLRWNAWYSDYGAEANVEAFAKDMGGRTLVLVFMHSSNPKGPAARDQRFILEHVKYPSAA